jgi:hypothetical protein
MSEMGEIAPEGNPQLHKMQQLESKFDEVQGLLLNVYKKHDQIIHDIFNMLPESNFLQGNHGPAGKEVSPMRHHK